MITSNKKNPQENGICLKQASLSLVQKEDYRGSVSTRVFLFCFITIFAYLVIPAFNTVSATHTIHRGTVITAPTALHKRKRETNQTAGVHFRITNLLSQYGLKMKKWTKHLHNSGSYRNQNFDSVSSFL